MWFDLALDFADRSIVSFLRRDDVEQRPEGRLTEWEGDIYAAFIGIPTSFTLVKIAENGLEPEKYPSHFLILMVLLLFVFFLFLWATLAIGLFVKNRQDYNLQSLAVGLILWVCVILMGASIFVMGASIPIGVDTPEAPGFWFGSLKFRSSLAICLCSLLVFTTLVTNRLGIGQWIHFPVIGWTVFYLFFYILALILPALKLS